LLRKYLALELDRAFEAEAADQIVHAVQAAQHGILATPRRSDERRDRVFLERNSRIANRLDVTVKQLSK
jgi:hypothetical protein